MRIREAQKHTDPTVHIWFFEHVHCTLYRIRFESTVKKCKLFKPQKIVIKLSGNTDWIRDLRSKKNCPGSGSRGPKSTGSGTTLLVCLLLELLELGENPRVGVPCTETYASNQEQEGSATPPPPLQPMNYLAAVLKDAQILPTLTTIFSWIGLKIQ